ncbi:TonB-dependent receptor plug domain-containing protein [Chitinophaga nivalis]|uniref:TonB-dependent receptor n=1 Tax=Chitinophaga nivalis TaxID=2991709 RepID=A0ABT3IGH2_9BACT|nr:TonB-dependent receptor [Chitinophaga nivalis]MCW3483006.1 TonB-dependent receptor [Chitinophaga nivalis]
MASGIYLLIAGNAVAQTTTKDTLREVRVDAKRIPAYINPVTPVQTLTGKKLERLNSLSVGDAIRYFSGVQLKDYGGVGGLKTINVRSMGSHHTTVFYDGMMIGNVQNGQVDLSKFSLDNIAEISLYNGQKNNIFQPARAFSAGNVLFLQSKIPVFNEGETIHGKVSVKTGSSGLINPAILWQQKINKRITATVSTEWINANGRYKFHLIGPDYDSLLVRQNGNVNAFRAEAALNGVLRDSSTWNLKYYYYSSARGLPGATVAGHYTYGQHLKDQDMFAQGTWSKKISRKYSIMANVKYSNFYNVYTDPEYLNEAGFLQNRYLQQEVYASLANKYTFTPWWEASLSGDVIVNTLNANIQRFPYPSRYTGLVSLASRWHFKRFEMQGNLLATLVNESVKAYEGAGNKREYTPAISVAWQPLAHQNLWLRAFYKNIFRMPTFNDLYYTYIGNNNLRPEYVKHYDAGFTYTKAFRGSWQYLSIQADAYYIKATDKIVAVPAANLFGWSMMNLGQVIIKGTDVNINSAWMPIRDVMLNLALTYTYQDARDRTTGKNAFNYGAQIPYTPWHSGTFLAGIDWKALTLNYSFIYTGERYNQIGNNEDNYVQPWYTSDISASWSLQQGAYQYKLTGELNNLLNQQYDVIANFPMPGRNYRVTLSVHF